MVHSGEGGICGLRVRDDHHIESHGEVVSLVAKGFAKPAFHTIPIHSISDFPANGEPHAGLVGTVAHEQNHHQSAPNAVPGSLHALDID